MAALGIVGQELELRALYAAAASASMPFLAVEKGHSLLTLRKVNKTEKKVLRIIQFGANASLGPRMGCHTLFVEECG